MGSAVTEWLLQNREKIEKGVDIIGQASEVLAVTVGQLHPVLEAVFRASAELLSNPEGKEAQYLTEQFSKINEKLEDIQAELNQISLELQKTSMNKQNFDREAQMISQYEKFQEFVNAKNNFKEKKKEKFLSHFENTDADMNLDSLYYAVTGENTSGDPMLETVVATEQRSRRAVEDFCASLKKLFVVGIIAAMGYASLKEGQVGDETVKKWQERMEDVENRMKAAVDDCTKNFAEQAKQDMEGQLKEKPGSVNIDFTKSLLDMLVKKYDWVSWSLRVFSDTERNFIFNCLAGKNYHGSAGNPDLQNHFDVITNNNIKVVISFCVEPKPIDKELIQKQTERQKLKGNMVDVAQSLREGLPNYLVHAISRYKEVENRILPETTSVKLQQKDKIFHCHLLSTDL
ncbi:hypothetical protein DPEC_G00352340 [Dallia pectoralis]|uniref:Uncharacterized protein n=1 Tax=Dallia pectoralis TaxID=75939 RepID=A0ACC2F273_DALPE|nr:hypothetical protein DPEC_G00352340 [Dallia pectoralis]